MTRKQCEHCPWKVSTDPFDIPDGYCANKHRALSSTIAQNVTMPELGDALHIMSCHEFPVGRELPCVGWLANQLGIGSNIPLRLAVRSGRIDADIELDGEQHKSLEDTLPGERWD